MKRRRLLQSALALSLWGCGDDGVQGRVVARGSVVLALGDSLTAGFGAGKGEDYPSLLANKTGWQVVNGGVSGDTSAAALARLPALLGEYRPSLVIISIGGNDFLRRQPERDTRQHIERMIGLIKEQGAQMVLVGVPALDAGAVLGIPSDHELYEELAKKHRLALYASGWGEVLQQASLRSDQIHPNASGYAVFTEGFYRFLRKNQFVR